MTGYFIAPDADEVWCLVVAYSALGMFRAG